MSGFPGGHQRSAGNCQQFPGPDGNNPNGQLRLPSLSPRSPLVPPPLLVPPSLPNHGRPAFPIAGPHMAYVNAQLGHVQQAVMSPEPMIRLPPPDHHPHHLHHHRPEQLGIGNGSNYSVFAGLDQGMQYSQPGSLYIPTNSNAMGPPQPLHIPEQFFLQHESFPGLVEARPQLLLQTVQPNMRSRYMDQVLENGGAQLQSGALGPPPEMNRSPPSPRPSTSAQARMALEMARRNSNGMEMQQEGERPLGPFTTQAQPRTSDGSVPPFNIQAGIMQGGAGISQDVKDAARDRFLCNQDRMNSIMDGTRMQYRPSVVTTERHDSLRHQVRLLTNELTKQREETAEAHTQCSSSLKKFKEDSSKFHSDYKELCEKPAVPQERYDEMVDKYYREMKAKLGQKEAEKTSLVEFASREAQGTAADGTDGDSRGQGKESQPFSHEMLFGETNRREELRHREELIRQHIHSQDAAMAAGGRAFTQQNCPSQSITRSVIESMMSGRQCRHMEYPGFRPEIPTDYQPRPVYIPEAPFTYVPSSMATSPHGVTDAERMQLSSQCFFDGIRYPGMASPNDMQPFHPQSRSQYQLGYQMCPQGLQSVAQVQMQIAHFENQNLDQFPISERDVEAMQRRILPPRPLYHARIPLGSPPMHQQVEQMSMQQCQEAHSHLMPPGAERRGASFAPSQPPREALQGLPGMRMPTHSNMACQLMPPECIGHVRPSPTQYSVCGDGNAMPPQMAQDPIIPQIMRPYPPVHQHVDPEQLIRMNPELQRQFEIFLRMKPGGVIGPLREEIRLFMIQMQNSKQREERMQLEISRVRQKERLEMERQRANAQRRRSPGQGQRRQVNRQPISPEISIPDGFPPHAHHRNAHNILLCGGGVVELKLPPAPPPPPPPNPIPDILTQSWYEVMGNEEPTFEDDLVEGEGAPVANELIQGANVPMENGQQPLGGEQQRVDEGHPLTRNEEMGHGHVQGMDVAGMVAADNQALGHEQVLPGEQIQNMQLQVGGVSLPERMEPQHGLGDGMGPHPSASAASKLDLLLEAAETEYRGNKMGSDDPEDDPDKLVIDESVIINDVGMHGAYILGTYADDEENEVREQQQEGNDQVSQHQAETALMDEEASQMKPLDLDEAIDGNRIADDGD